MKLKNLTSDLQLGIRLLFLEPVKKLMAEPGSRTFAKNYFPEGLVPTTVADRGMLRLASRCVGCGLCDAAPGPGPRPSLLPTSLSKSSGDLTAATNDLRTLSAARLEVAEALCPERVPLRVLHGFLLERHRRVEAQEAVEKAEDAAG